MYRASHVTMMRLKSQDSFSSKVPCNRRGQSVVLTAHQVNVIIEGG